MFNALHILLFIPPLTAGGGAGLLFSCPTVRPLCFGPSGVGAHLALLMDLSGFFQELGFDIFKQIVCSALLYLP